MEVKVPGEESIKTKRVIELKQTKISERKL
jgi:hypothetical protein